MIHLRTMVRQFVRNERAATMVEYALMVALIALVCVAAVKLVGDGANTAFDNTQLCINDPSKCP
jgi:pilus assembly protein Flp/PilA